MGVSPTVGTLATQGEAGPCWLFSDEVELAPGVLGGGLS